MPNRGGEAGDRGRCLPEVGVDGLHALGAGSAATRGRPPGTAPRA